MELLFYRSLHARWYLTQIVRPLLVSLFYLLELVLRFCWLFTQSCWDNFRLRNIIHLDINCDATALKKNETEKYYWDRAQSNDCWESDLVDFYLRSPNSSRHHKHFLVVITVNFVAKCVPQAAMLNQSIRISKGALLPGLCFLLPRHLHLSLQILFLTSRFTFH